MVKLKLIRAPVPNETIWKLGRVDQENLVRMGITPPGKPLITVETRQFITSGTKPVARTGYDMILVKDLPELDTRLWLELKINVDVEE